MERIQTFYKSDAEKSSQTPSVNKLISAEAQKMMFKKQSLGLWAKALHLFSKLPSHAGR